MISVEAALAQVFALARPPEEETVPLRRAAGRVLVQPVAASRDQPPFAASAMDGYALRAADAASGARLRVIGTAAAGAAFAGRVDAGAAVRIFTGAPVPDGADTVVMQEAVTATRDAIRLDAAPEPGANIRPAGTDFRAGAILSAPRRLRPVDLARLAAMNVPQVRVARRPRVALIATGDELVMPGEDPRADQIIASNTFPLAALIEADGGAPQVLPIARDCAAALATALDLAAGADLIVTIGGASVGDHDLVAGAVAERGGTLSFHKIALRPGKPLMAGRIGTAAMIGLPGNPVSAYVCALVFVLPLLRAMHGLPAVPAPRLRAPLTAPIERNGPREHYMRARLGPDGITAFDRQDSALLSVLSEADALVIRPPGDGPRSAGEMVDYLPL